MEVTSFSHVGQREENQDRCAVFRSADERFCLMLVADGLGGHSGGALAAETVVDVAQVCWDGRPAGEQPNALLRRLVSECHRAVRGTRQETGLDPHSTLAALLLANGRATSAHVGDSRVIQFSRGGLFKRTVDHSAAQLLALAGEIAEEEIATHPSQKVVFLQIGGARPPEPTVTEWDLGDGENFVLCSDGFWGIFSPEEMLELLAADDPADEAVERLGPKLEHLTGHDNVTAVFVRGSAGVGSGIGACVLQLLWGRGLP